MKLDGFVRRSATAPPAIVVSSSDVALSVVRDLGSEDVPVLAMSPDGAHAAFRSRYCAARRCADPHYDEPQLIADLEAVAALLPQRAVLFPCDDDFCVAVSRHKARLQGSFIVPVLAWEAMQTLADKERQLALARRAGVEAPITAFIHGPDDLDAAAAAVPFPAILKPAVPKGCFRTVEFKVVRVADRTQLERAYAPFAAYGSFLLQEIIPGPDGEVFIAGAYHDAHSRCLALFTGRKLRQHPRGFGVSRLCESGWSEKIAELTLQILAEVGYQGVSDVEFKRDPRDGRFKIMEINARQGYWIALARAAGVNLSYIAYRDAIGRPCPRCRQRDGVRWSDLLHDGPDSLRELRGGELSLRDWLEPLLGVRADAYLSLHDPRPGLYATPPLVGRLAKRGYRASALAGARMGSATIHWRPRGVTTLAHLKAVPQVPLRAAGAALTRPSPPNLRRAVVR
jgi:predicted ATP-grasp superfamily ATP-dependent carboligase